VVPYPTITVQEDAERAGFSEPLATAACLGGNGEISGFGSDSKINPKAWSRPAWRRPPQKRHNSFAQQNRVVRISKALLCTAPHRLLR
jgi:hypothetical protein